MNDFPKYIGPFELRDRLGHGGMGMVYLAYDPMLDRSVAVKVLRVPDEETRRRFLREARLHAKVQHPHIVSIYAVGEHEGQPYLAMEYIAGHTLAAIIRNGEDVPLARRVTWLAELSAGLDHAHRYGVVHRDVKPSNILVTRETGRLRLLDFGIAHGQEALGMTMAGTVIGTPQYMSPEQITGRTVDARSDIFSVGLVGYELLTGRQAFGGDNVFDVSRRIVGEAPPALASACRDAPATLLRIIERCLEKSPDDRYQEARQLERELMAVVRRLDPDHMPISMPMTAPTAVLESQAKGTGDPISLGDDDDDLCLSRSGHTVGDEPSGEAAPAATSPRRGWLLPAAALVLVLAAAMVYWYARPGSLVAPDAAASGALPRGHALTAATGTGADAADVSAMDTATASGAEATGTVVPISTSGTAAGSASADVTVSRIDSAAENLRRVQQLSAAGRYLDAFAALGQTGGLSRSALQAEQRKLAEGARQRADVARQTASDFRAGATGAFLQGGARMQQGDDNLEAGNMRQAVVEFARAHEAFMTALATRAAQAGVPAPTVPAVPASAPAIPTAAGSEAPNADEPVKAAGSGPSRSAPTPTPAQARAVVAQYRQAYEAKSITGLQRLWPSMDPATERVLRGVFGIPGEVQWIPVDQKVIPQPDLGRATVIATVMTITPLVGGESARREVNVTIEVIPQGDAFVIAALRQR